MPSSPSQPAVSSSGAERAHTESTVAAGSWAAKAMQPPSLSPSVSPSLSPSGAWGKTATEGQRVPDLTESQAFPGLPRQTEPQRGTERQRGMPSMAEVAAAPPPQNRDPASVLDMLPQKQVRLPLSPSLPSLPPSLPP